MGVVMQESGCSSVGVGTFLNSLRAQTDKIDDPQALNLSQLVDNGIPGLVVFGKASGTTAPPNTSKVLERNTVQQAPMPHHGATKQQQPSTGFQTKRRLQEYICKKKKKHPVVVRDERPYIKKPPNAFMLFMKEQRPTIAPELWRQGSGAVNQLLGKMWGAMTKEEKAVYFTEAERLKRVHRLENPGWSNKVNYGKKRRRDRATSQNTAKRTPPLTESFVRKKKEAQPNVIFGNYLQMEPMAPCYPPAAYIQNFQPHEAYIQHPQQGPYMQCPQQGPYMQFPQQGVYMQFPQQAFMQFPRLG